MFVLIGQNLSFLFTSTFTKEGQVLFPSFSPIFNPRIEIFGNKHANKEEMIRKIE